MSNVYQENGFKNRKEYLEDLANNYGLTLADILPLANLLGPEEDFDGLVTSVEDYSDEIAETKGWRDE